MYSALLRLAREESDTLILSECAACLGELGAVDPSRLRLVPQKMSSSKRLDDVEKYTKSSSTSNDEESNSVIQDLAVRMLEIHLVGALRQRNTDAGLYQRIAFAIQETLKFIYRCSSSSTSTTTTTRFPEELEILLSKSTLEVVRPYWSTSYQMNPNRMHRVLGPNSPSHFELFEFDSEQLVIDEESGRYREWALRWAKDLCARVKIVAKDEKDESWNLFRIAESVLSLLPSLAKDILPLAAWRVLRYGNNDDVARLRKEIRTVLTSTCTSSSARRCMQTVFEILDHLVSRYHRERKKKKSRNRRETSNSMSDEEIRLKSNVQSIMLKEPLMAAASFRCDAVTRALKHWESHLQGIQKKEKEKEDTEKSSSSVSSSIPSSALTQDGVTDEPSTISTATRYYWSRQQLRDLQRIYERLDEPDGLWGIAAIRPSLISSDDDNNDDDVAMMWERIVEYEQSGDWNDAMACYEHLLGTKKKNTTSIVAQRSDDPIVYHRGIVRCLLNDGHFASALNYVAGAKTTSFLSAYAMEAAWQLGRWDILKSYHETANENKTNVTKESHETYATAHTRALLCLREKKFKACKIAIREARLVAIQRLAISCAESYSRAYPEMLHLHAIRDIEYALRIVESGENDDYYLQSQRRRLGITMHDMSRQELIAHSRVLRRICGGDDSKEGQSWLQAAELARKSRRFQFASKALLNASAFASISKSFAIKLRIERAELLYGQDQVRRALLELEPLCIRNVGGDEKHEQARALLLYTEWQQRSGRTQGEGVIYQYKQVLKWRNDWARAHFCLGNYYDWLLMQRLKDEQKRGNDRTMDGARIRLIQADECEYLLEILHHYGMALESSGRNGDVGGVVYVGIEFVRKQKCAELPRDLRVSFLFL